MFYKNGSRFKKDNSLLYWYMMRVNVKGFYLLLYSIGLKTLSLLTLNVHCEQVYDGIQWYLLNIFLLIIKYAVIGTVW